MAPANKCDACGKYFDVQTDKEFETELKGTRENLIPVTLRISVTGNIAYDLCYECCIIVTNKALTAFHNRNKGQHE